MDPSPEEVRAEVGRVLTAPSFQRSERLSRFLRFVVDGVLEGKRDQLKEYVLGVEVYQKGADFEPRVDSTVRVEAARLRSKLREYYETEGRANPVRIELPKGGYRPRFQRVEKPQTRVIRPRAGVWISGLLAIVVILVFVSQLRSRSVSINATVFRPFTTWQGEETEPALSPDGSMMAMVWSGETRDNADIYVKPIGEGPRLRLTSHPARERRPAWSPDGRLIAFLRRDGGDRAGVYVVPAQGGTERLITSAMWFASVLDWFPDGQALVVAGRDSPEAPIRIFQVRIASGARRPLTSPPPKSHGDWQAAISPDGSMLAIVRSISMPACDIYLAPVRDGEPRRLTFENQVITGLAWGADGKSIVFSSERGATAGAGSLWRIQTDGLTAPRLDQVQGAGPRASWPTISRRAQLLAYQETHHDTNLWLVPATSRGVPVLVVSSTREETRPDYSPDGSRIAFSSNRSGNWEVWAAKPDGSASRQLTSFGGAPAWDPRWSPDGRMIAFHHVAQGNSDIYTMTPEGASATRLTNEPSHEEGPSWSKDGRWLYFASNRSGRLEIWKISASDHAQLTQVTGGGGTSPLESPDGKYLYFLRDREVWRLPVNGGSEIRVHGPIFGVQAWVPDATGIYFANSRNEIAHYDFEARSLRTVVPPLDGLRAVVRGLTLSPDGRWLLYGKLDRVISDIMIAENFH